MANLTVKVGADVDKLVTGLNKATNQLSGFGKRMTAIGGMMAGAFSVGAIINFQKQVIDITSKFQNFAAVLENTLGSSSEAQKAMDMIREFAAKTPFSVENLMGAFVKLANQGFQPTRDEMRKLGDLASSTGKSFDQLAEAIIDAQVSEFERLKEFGIRAKKEGDNVKFTFKGVETTVANTSEAIRDYVLSLGDAVGVSGAMEKQSETLGGKMSNLGDAWDGLMLSIGSGESGPLKAAIEALTDFVTQMQLVFKSTEQIKKEATARAWAESLTSQQLRAVEEFKTGIAKNYKDIQKAASVHNSYLQSTIDRLKQEFESATGSRKQSVADQIKLLEAEVQAVTEYATKIVGEEKKKQDAYRKTAQAKTVSAAPAPGFENRQSSGVVEFDVRPIDTSPLTNLASVTESVAARMQKAVVPINNSLQSIPQTTLDIAPIIEAGLENAAMSIGEGIGNMIADAGSISDLGSVLLGTLGGVMVQLGQMAIQTGISIKAIQVALKSLNPYVAIAAGIALVALGTAVKARSAKIGSGMGKGGGGGSGGAGSSFSPSSGSRNMQDAQDSSPKLTTAIRGQDIWVILENYKNNNKNTKLVNG